ncbi:MAG TPA: transposase [Myxococcales bacterium]|jgi:REP element-mobilizing transposase RayT
MKRRLLTSFQFKKRGGKRPGAGRPRLREHPGLIGPGVPHRARKPFHACKAVHVTQRVRPGVGSLRKQGPAQVLLAAFRDAANGGRMRIAHYSVQGNHLHFVVEAEDTDALSRGMQGLAIRIARRLNRRLGRAGPVFADRYHARLLSSPREIANAIRYVVGNYRQHTREWLPEDFRDPLATTANRPLESPRLWLLRDGWRALSRQTLRQFEPP